jgi:FMN phosphatase YigB (HAD superfamily)
MNRPEPEKDTPVIVVDAGKVLVDYNFRPLLGELSQRAGKAVNPFDFPDFDQTMRSIYKGEVSMDELRDRLNAHLRLGLTAQEWRELWCGVLTGEVSGMYDVLLSLRPGFRIVALTNTEIVHWSHVRETYPIFGLLDGWVASFEVGLAKPDPGIFQLVMDRYCNGRAPVFYTDDNPDFVEAARSLGWAAEVFRSADDLHAAISERAGGNHENPGK